LKKSTVPLNGDDSRVGTAFITCRYTVCCCTTPASDSSSAGRNVVSFCFQRQYGTSIVSEKSADVIQSARGGGLGGGSGLGGGGLGHAPYTAHDTE